MLTRRNKKELPAREQNIVDSCMEPKSSKEITHILVQNTFNIIQSGLYIYNPVTEILTSLDDDMIGMLKLKDVVKNSSYFRPYRHIPTWNQMVENGEVKDMRTKKDDEEEAQPMRRGLTTEDKPVVSTGRRTLG